MVNYTTTNVTIFSKLCNFANEKNVKSKIYTIMRRIFTILLTLFAITLADTAWAQFSVEDDTKKKTAGEVTVKNQLQNINANTEYYSEAKAKLERQRIRKERNTFETTFKLQGTMTSYNDAWTETKGGDNAISVLGSFNMVHTYKKDEFSNNTQLSAKYGYNRLRVDTEDGNSEGVWFKNIDEFWLQVQPKLALNKKWSYTAMFKFKSQFSNSYLSRTHQTENDVITGFLAPGNMDFSLGMDFTSPSTVFPIKVSLFPLSGNGVIAKNELVERYYRNKSALSWFGVDIDKNFLFTGGSSVKFEFKRSWGKNNWFTYDTNLYCYYAWITNVSTIGKIREYRVYLDELEKWEAQGSPEGLAPASVPRHMMLYPTIDWRNSFRIKASKYFETELTLNMFYDNAQNKSVMLKSFLSLGLTYTFKNK